MTGRPDEGLGNEDVGRGTIYIAFQRAVYHLSGLVFALIVARVLGEDEIGQMSLYVLFINVFVTVVSLALPVATTKFVSENIGKSERETAGAVTRASLKWLLLSSTAALIIVVLTSPILSWLIFGEKADTLTLSVTAAAAFGLAVLSLFEGVMWGLGLFSKSALQRIIYIITVRALGLSLAFIGFGVMGVMIGWLAGGVAGVMYGLVVLEGRLPLKKGFPSGMLFAYSMPVYTYSLISLAQNWIDIPLMYAFTKNLEVVGIYYLVITGVNIVSFIWISIGTTVLPAISKRVGTRGLDGAVEPLNVSTRLLNISVIPLGMSLAALAPTALLVAYGPSYVQGASAFALIAATLILAAQDYNLTVALQGIGKTRPLVKIGIFSTIGEVAALAIFAGTMGVVGGAIAKTVMNVLSFVLSYRALSSHVKFKLTDGLARSLLFSLVLAIPLYVVDTYATQSFASNLPLRVALDLLVFFAGGMPIARIFRVFSKKDFDLLTAASPRWLHRILGFSERLLVGSKGV